MGRLAVLAVATPPGPGVPTVIVDSGIDPGHPLFGKVTDLAAVSGIETSAEHCPA